METPPEEISHRVLEAMRSCVLHFGWGKTSIQDIAQAARLSRGTIYRYFGDRPSLLRAYQDWEVARFFERVSQRAAHFESLEDRLVAYAVTLYESARTLQMIPGVSAWEQVVRLLFTGPVAEHALERAIDFLVPYIEAATSRKEIRAGLDPRRAAEWVARAAVSLLTLPPITVDFDDPDDLRAFVRAHIVRGLT